MYTKIPSQEQIDDFICSNKKERAELARKGFESAVTFYEGGEYADFVDMFYYPSAHSMTMDHALGMHAGKSDEDLFTRAVNDPINGASGFYGTRMEASQLINEMLRDKNVADFICTFLFCDLGAASYTVYKKYGRVIGRSFPRHSSPGDAPIPCTAIKMVVARDNQRNGFKVVTAFPVPEYLVED